MSIVSVSIGILAAAILALICWIDLLSDRIKQLYARIMEAENKISLHHAQNERAMETFADKRKFNQLMDLLRQHGLFEFTSDGAPTMKGCYTFDDRLNSLSGSHKQTTDRVIAMMISLEKLENELHKHKKG